MAPELPGSYVPREPLRQRLHGFMQRRLTVLRAPAGFGKTTVLTDIARDTSGFAPPAMHAPNSRRAGAMACWRRWTRR